jgi:hypothetical protein
LPVFDLFAFQAESPLPLQADTPLPHPFGTAIAKEHREAYEDRDRAEPSWKLAKSGLEPEWLRVAEIPLLMR